MINKLINIILINLIKIFKIDNHKWKNFLKSALRHFLLVKLIRINLITFISLLLFDF